MKKAIKLFSATILLAFFIFPNNSYADVTLLDQPIYNASTTGATFFGMDMFRTVEYPTTADIPEWFPHTLTVKFGTAGTGSGDYIAVFQTGIFGQASVATSTNSIHLV